MNGFAETNEGPPADDKNNDHIHSPAGTAYSYSLDELRRASPQRRHKCVNPRLLLGHRALSGRLREGGSRNRLTESVMVAKEGF
jgi:hypothetical protein